MRHSVLLCFLVLQVGCSDDEHALLVDIRTDYAPRAEFFHAQVDVAGVLQQERVARLSEDWLAGIRAAQFEVRDGAHVVRVSLVGATEVVATREVVVDVRGRTAVTVALTRNCAGVDCPAEDPEATSCLGGVCVDPRCLSGDEPQCDLEQCDSNAQCAETACSIGACLSNVCFSGADTCGDGEFCQPEAGVCESIPDPPDAQVGDAGVEGDAGVPLNCDPADHCGSSGFLCGVHQVASCGEVDCGACRYQNMELNEVADIALDPQRGVHVAYGSGNTARYLTWVDGAVVEEEIGISISVDEISLAVGADAVHVAYGDLSDRVHYSTRDAMGIWSHINTDLRLEAPRIVLDRNDQPMVIGMHHIFRTPHRVDFDAEPPELVDLGLDPVVVPPTLLRAPDGDVVLVYVSSGQLRVYEQSGSTFALDENPPGLGPQSGFIGAAFDSSGRLHVLALVGDYTLRTGSELRYLVRDDTGWTNEVLYEAIDDGIDLAVGPSDEVHLLYHVPGATRDGTYYSRPGSSVSLNIDPHNDSGRVKMVVDADDQPHMLLRGSYWAALARYPDAYITACADAPDVICERSCMCGDGGDCCWREDEMAGGSESNGCTFGPSMAGMTLCQGDFARQLCGDLTAAPDLVMTCLSELSADSPICVENAYVVRAPSCWDAISAP